MKGLLRALIIHSIVLWLIASYIGGVEYGNDVKVLVLGALALTVADSLLKPFINILLLPFNLVTLGTFRWLSSALTLYVSTLVVPNFTVHAFRYPGLISSFFIIPSLDFSLLWAYIILSIIISFLVSLIYWIVK